MITFIAAAFCCLAVTDPADCRLNACDRDHDRDRDRDHDRDRDRGHRGHRHHCYCAAPTRSVCAPSKQRVKEGTATVRQLD